MQSLVTAVIWAAVVAAALRPPFRRGPLGFTVFVLAMAVNEIPLVLLVVFVASMLASGLPDPRTAVTVAGAVSAVVVLSLIWLQLRARGARHALDAALATELGPGWRGEPPGRATGRYHWCGGIFRPFERRSRVVVRTRNVRYGPHRRAHRLDVYRPRATWPQAESRPVLIHLHGGGFVQGNKSREGVFLLNQLASHGWVCVSANYRLRRDADFPAPLEDTKRVIAWSRRHASDFGADPTQVFVIGSSAGGHLAVSAGLTANQPRFQPDFLDVDTSVSGAVVLYGYLGPLTADRASSPITLGHQNAPPMLMIHGSNETAVPPDGPRAVAAELRSSSLSPVVFAELPAAQHEFDLFASMRARATADAVEDFLDWSCRHRGLNLG